MPFNNVSYFSFTLRLRLGCNVDNVWNSYRLLLLLNLGWKWLLFFNSIFNKVFTLSSYVWVISSSTSFLFHNSDLLMLSDLLMRLCLVLWFNFFLGLHSSFEFLFIFFLFFPLFEYVAESLAQIKEFKMSSSFIICIFLVIIVKVYSLILGQVNYLVVLALFSIIPHLH